MFTIFDKIVNRFARIKKQQKANINVEACYCYFVHLDGIVQLVLLPKLTRHFLLISLYIPEGPCSNSWGKNQNKGQFGHYFKANVTCYFDLHTRNVCTSLQECKFKSNKQKVESQINTLPFLVIFNITGLQCLYHLQQYPQYRFYNMSSLRTAL